MTERRRLCTRCYGAAVEREQKKARPLPAVIDPSRMEHVTASAGKCSLYGLETATWKGDAGRLCDAFYRLEVRPGLEVAGSVTISVG